MASSGYKADLLIETTLHLNVTYLNEGRERQCIHLFSNGDGGFLFACEDLGECSAIRSPPALFI